MICEEARALESHRRLDTSRLRVACSNCSLRDLCVPMGLDRQDLAQLDAVVQKSGAIQTGDHLFSVGDEFQALYAVRSGCFKTYTIDRAGREQVLGFHLPGELLGLDAIASARHQCNAIALDTASSCLMPFQDITQLAAEVPGLQRQMFRLLSENIAQSHALAGDYSADERLAAFLLGLSERFTRRGYSPTEFNLTMPRRDIANYLRLATETVSRVFNRFQKNELIEVERRQIRLVDLDGLRDLASSALLHVA